MVDKELENMAFELVEKDMESLVATHLVLGDESFMAATICTMIVTYCEKSKIDVQRFSNAINQTLMDYVNEENV